jgi:hypothetical protein
MRKWFEAEKGEWGGKQGWKWGNGGSAGPVWEVEPESLIGERPMEEEVGGWDLRAPGMGWRGLVRKGERRKDRSSSLVPTSFLRAEITPLVL